VALLKDADPEIRAQAAKWLGDIRYKEASKELIANLTHENARVRFFSAEALGRAKDAAAIQPLIQLLAANNDEDAFLRHGASFALSQIGQVAPLAALSTHPSKAVRMGSVIALRRLASPELAKFLGDAEEDIVTEVARAIHDDLSVPAAMPKLAALLATTPFTNEPLIRRVISANQRLGKEENLNYVLGYLAKPGVSEALKKESLATLGTWASPSVLDRVDGRYRGEVTRDPALVKQKVAATLELQAKSSAVELRRESIKAMGKLGMVDMADFLFGKLKTDPSQEVKVEALNSLVVMNASNLSDAIAYAMRDVSEGVRVAGLGLIAQTSLPNDQKVPLLMDILKKRTLAEKQTALLTLGSLEGSKDFKEWSTILEDFKLGKLPEGTWIELEESILATGSANLKTQYESLLDQKAGGEAWKKYVGALAPGNIEKGRNIFFQNQTAQCIRCHAYDDMGGNAGPALDNIGKTLSKEDLLIALVEPSKRLSPGYGSVTLTLVAGTKVTGLLLEDNKDSMRVKVGTEVKEIAKKDIASSALGASSMPPMGTLLTKRDIRDLVSYLSTLKRSE
jgi:putative heme-binding domain-containing protein